MKPTEQQIEAAAAAIANARGGRRGMPPISNVLKMLETVSPKLLAEVKEDAQAALEAVSLDEHLEPTLEKLIEAVQMQGCVKLKSGEEGIPRSIKITPEGEEIDVDTMQGHFDAGIDEIQEIVFVG